MAKNIFMAIFIVLCLYLLTTKLRCLKKNDIGHTNLTLYVIENTGLECYSNIGVDKARLFSFGVFNLSLRFIYLPKLFWGIALMQLSTINSLLLAQMHLEPSLVSMLSSNEIDILCGISEPNEIHQNILIPILLMSTINLALHTGIVIRTQQ